LVRRSTNDDGIRRKAGPCLRRLEPQPCYLVVVVTVDVDVVDVAVVVVVVVIVEVEEIRADG
jgi:hypothetical protein